MVLLNFVVEPFEFGTFARLGGPNEAHMSRTLLLAFMTLLIVEAYVAVASARTTAAAGIGEGTQATSANAPAAGEGTEGEKLPPDPPPPDLGGENEHGSPASELELLAPNTPIDHRMAIRGIEAELARVANKPDRSWWAPVAVLASGTLSFLASFLILFIQQRRATKGDQGKKEMLFHLLHDEITMRWTGEISQNFREVFIDSAGDFEAAGERLVGAVFSREDTFVLQTVSRSFSDYSFLGDNELVSDIVHAFVLVGDLIDAQKKGAELILGREDEIEKLEPNADPIAEADIRSKYREDIVKFAKHFEDKLKKTDEKFNTILLGIEM